jgi:histidinol-phosphate aminotransferase
MAIRYILETFGEKRKDIVTVSPTFEMYWVNCSILGLNHKPVPYENDLTIDIDKIVSAIDENTRLVALVNPNNPVGNVYSDSDIKKVIEKAKSVGAIVLIDEAYHYFYPNTFVRYALEEENVIVTRTFSKTSGLAAVRMGVIITNEKLAHYIKNSKLTFDCNAISLLFAERIIDNPDVISKLINSSKLAKEYTIIALKDKNYEIMPSEGNFIFIKTKKDAHFVSNVLEKDYKILVHPYKNPLLKNFLRVSIGSIESMNFFFSCFFKVDLD